MYIVQIPKNKVKYSTEENTGTQMAGKVLQFWIDYDKRKMSVMELDTEKSDYINYLEYE